MGKECLECGATMKGRIDRKFCGDFCRNSYNNKIKMERSAYPRQINNILNRNRKILAFFLPGETNTVSRERLEDKGFNFRHITQVEGPNYYCYEFGYSLTEDGRYLLMRKKESN